MAYQAGHNDRRAIFNDAIPLNATGAMVYYWTIVSLGVMFLVLAVLPPLARRLANPQILELAEDAVLLPHGFLRRRTSRIPYADIKRVWEANLFNQTLLHVATAQRNFEIVASMLPDLDSYRAVRDFMYSHAPVVRRHDVEHESPIGVTREEFISRQAAAEHQIRRQVIPVGIIYAILLAMIFAITSLVLLLCILPLTDFPSDGRTVIRVRILWILGFCVLLVAISLLAERDGRRRFTKLGLKCPSCHKFLMFTSGKLAAATGRCDHCGERVFDT
jgi:hypothetical protein